MRKNSMSLPGDKYQINSEDIEIMCFEDGECT